AAEPEGEGAEDQEAAEERSHGILGPRTAVRGLEGEHSKPGLRDCRGRSRCRPGRCSALPARAFPGGDRGDNGFPCTSRGYRWSAAYVRADTANGLSRR